METKFAKYKKLIELQLQELTAEDELGQSSQRTVELDQQSVGRLSRMDALQSQAMAQAQQRRRDTLKTSLVAALQRLEEEEFGFAKYPIKDFVKETGSAPGHSSSSVDSITSSMVPPDTVSRATFPGFHDITVADAAYTTAYIYFLAKDTVNGMAQYLSE